MKQPSLFAGYASRRLRAEWKEKFAAWPQTAQRLFLTLMGRRLPALRDLPQDDKATVELLKAEVHGLPASKIKYAHLVALLRRIQRAERIKTQPRRINDVIDGVRPGSSITVYVMRDRTGASLSECSAALESAVSAGVLHRRRMAQSVAISYIKNHTITQP